VPGTVSHGVYLFPPLLSRPLPFACTEVRFSLCLHLAVLIDGLPAHFPRTGVSHLVLSCFLLVNPMTLVPLLSGIAGGIFSFLVVEPYSKEKFSFAFSTRGIRCVSPWAWVSPSRFIPFLLRPPLVLLCSPRKSSPFFRPHFQCAVPLPHCLFLPPP